MTDIIFESPDKGNTVYYRRVGSVDRTLLYTSDSHSAYTRWMNLKDAIVLAENDATLNDSLSKFEMLYLLKKQEKSD